MSYYIARKNLLQLFPPNGIEILSSIAIHALILGVVLPNSNIFGSPTLKNDLQTVKITQLNEIELTRLPNLDPPKKEDLDRLHSSNYQQPEAITSLEPDSVKIEENKSLTGLNQIKIDSLLPPPPPTKINIPSVLPQPVQTEPTTIPAPNINPVKPVPQPKKQAIVNPRSTQKKTLEYPLSQTEIRDFRHRILQAKMQGRVRTIAKNNVNTSNEEARKNYITWLAKIQQEKPEELIISGTYPRDICIRKIAATVVYGIVVNAAGKASDPHLIKSSGYKIFDLQAERDLNEKTFEYYPDRANAYQVNVNFKYDSKICPSLALPS